MDKPHDSNCDVEIYVVKCNGLYDLKRPEI